MNDQDCTAFLQWALPQLNLRWAGFRKVRGQVCKRLGARLRALGLDDWAAYRTRLQADPSEWRVLDENCHITISRFFRDRGVFETLRAHVLPDIAARAAQEGREAKIWSAGCASGEEPYTLKILWVHDVERLQPGARLSIVASDVDQTMLARARKGCFKPSSSRELPPALIGEAFDWAGAELCLRPRLREGVKFVSQDLRSEAPANTFDVILCRYLAFTYFTVPLQCRVMASLLEHLRVGGYLVIGSHERMPQQTSGVSLAFGLPQIFRKTAED